MNVSNVEKVKMKRILLPILVIGLVLLLASSVVGCAPLPAPRPNPQYIYENGAIEIGADGEPIELINNPNATNPTYAELIAFIKEDSTDEHCYMSVEASSRFAFLSRVCSDFAEDAHNNAEAAGIRAAWVGIDFEGNDAGHACNAFETTDRGLVYIDCTGGDLGSWLAEHKVKIDKTKKEVSFEEYSLASRDKVAYVEIGKEYGCIALAKAKSLSYSFYEQYKQKCQEYKTLLSDYNDEVTQYNQEASRYVGKAPEAPDISEYGTSLEESRRLAAALQEWEAGMEAWKAKREAWVTKMEAWEARLKEKSQMIDEMAEELGDYWFEPLGIVKDIHIHWGGSG